MKRLLAVLFLLLCAPVYAQAPRQNAFSTAAMREWGQCVTADGHFGACRLAADPTCTTAMEGRLWENIVSHTFKACLNGAASGVSSTSLAFSGLSAGTNTTAAMVVGSGASLTTSGSGTITATSLTLSVSAQTGATYTTTASDSVITNTGNAGGLAVTLLNDPTAGVTYRICVTAAQSVSIAPSAGESLYFNGSTASSISTSTVGSCVTVLAAVGGSGGRWIVTAFSGPVS
jgi:hypothetical protein